MTPPTVDLSKKTWLADLVDDALARHDPAASLLRLPAELRGADPDGPSLEARARTLLVRSLRRTGDGVGSGASVEAGAAAEDPFLGAMEGHLGVLLDIAVVHGAPFERGRRRAELAALFSGLVGEIDLLRHADPARPGGGEAEAVQRALLRAGAELKARCYPAGDPKGGLPLRVGVLCIQRRHLARLAIAYYGQKSLELAAARKLAEQAAEDAALLVEALAAAAPAPLDARRRRTCLAQVTRLGLPRDLSRRARLSVKSPRGPAELARAAPVRLRGFLLEQLFIAELAHGPSPARAELLRTFAEEARIPPEQVAALQVAAAELYADQQRWLELPPGATPDEWEGVTEDWETFADQMMDRLATTVTANLEAIVTQVKDTGELGQLLAKAAAGHELSQVERVRMKAHLIDLAKAVPALAIFAAPGGLLLLPILAKLLPFNVLPSAWEKGKAKKPELPERTS